MPYRTPATIRRESGLNSDFWNDSNDFTEITAAIAADSQITNGLKKLMNQWYKVTQHKYPKDYHVILHDLNQARIGRGQFIRVGGKSRHLIGILLAAAELEGYLEVIPVRFDQSTATKKEMVVYTKESALRWIGEDTTIRQVLDAAFSANVSKLDKYFLAQFPEDSPKDVLEGVYFRAVAQSDLQTFNSPAMAQNLYHYLFD